MVGLRLLSLVTLLLTPCFAFNIVRNDAVVRSKVTIPTPTALSPLFGNQRSKAPMIFMTDDSKEPDETDETEVESVGSKETEVEESLGEKKVVNARTVLLSLPLFVKFAIVLLLKFATDLVVFPLLFLYRLAGIGKRKFLSLIGSGSDKLPKTNGET